MGGDGRQHHEPAPVAAELAGAQGQAAQPGRNALNDAGLRIVDQLAGAPVPTDVVCAAPAAKALPEYINVAVSFPKIPSLDAAGKDSGVGLQVNPAGKLVTTWQTSWYLKRLATCKDLGIDPYFYLAVQLLEFPGGRSEQKLAVSPTRVNNAVLGYILNRLDTSPAPVKQRLLAAVRFFEWIKAGSARPAMDAYAQMLIDKLTSIASTNGIDLSSVSAADDAGANTLLSQMKVISGREMIDATGAASGCLTEDAAAYSGNLAKPDVQGDIVALANKHKAKLSQIATGFTGKGRKASYIQAGDNREAAFAQSFLFLRKHQQQTMDAVQKDGMPISKALQLFNGPGKQDYFVAGGRGKTKEANIDSSPTYGATVAYLYQALQENPEVAQMVSQAFGGAVNQPLKDVITANLAADTFTESFAPATPEVGADDTAAGE